MHTRNSGEILIRDYKGQCPTLIKQIGCWGFLENDVKKQMYLETWSYSKLGSLISPANLDFTSEAVFEAEL